MADSRGTHPSQRRYPPELRERAVRMVLETFEQTGTRTGVITRIARQLGIGTESLRNWVRQAEVDGGLRPGTSSQDKERIAALEREVRELRRTNEILRTASAHSGGRCNSRGEPSSRRLVLEGLARPGVQPSLAATASRSAWLWTERSVCLGKY